MDSFLSREFVENPNREVEFYENEEEFGLGFPGGVDPNVLIAAIKKIDG